jgi:hypothetical protein
MIVSTPVKHSRSHVVNVTIRSKFDEKLISQKKMTRAEAISFSALWDFHHSESEFYIQNEEVK